MRAAGYLAAFVLGGLLTTAGEAQDILLPDLERFEPEVRTQLQELYDSATRSATRGAGTETGAAFGLLGETYLAYELPQEAESALAEAARLDPDEPRWPYFRALAALGQSRLGDAAAHFDRVLELRPEHLQALLRSGSNLLDLGRLDAAASRFEAARNAIHRAEADGQPRPGMKSALHFGLGRLAAERGRYEEAVSEFRAALELQPGADGVYYHLARALHRAGHADAARTAMSRRGDGMPIYRDPWTAAMKKRAESTQVDVVRGLKALKEGRLDDAEERLARALEATPEDGEALAGLGRTYQLRGEADRAEALYRRALAAQADAAAENGSADVGVLLNLGALLAARRDARSRDEALELFRRAAEADPRSASAHFNFGLALIRRGDSRQGERALLRALELRPGDAAILEAVESLARNHAARGELGRAADVYRSLLASPTAGARPELHFGLALALTLGGRCAEARPVLDAAVERFGTDVAASDALAGLLVRVLAGCPDDKARDGARAVELARTLFERSPSLEAGRSLAMALAEMGQYEEAAERLRRMIEAASRAGAAQALPVLRRELQLYERGEPVRSPWG